MTVENVRTCLSCRRKAQKLELCRFVRADDGEICFDEKGVMPRRGSWICAKKSCLSKACKKKLFFRDEQTIPVDMEAMQNTMARLIKRAVFGRLSLMKKLGTIEAGATATSRVIIEEKADIVVFAKDFSARSLDSIKRRVAKSKPMFIESSLLMDDLGRCLGRKRTGVVALRQSRIMDELLSRIDKLRELES